MYKFNMLSQTRPFFFFFFSALPEGKWIAHVNRSLLISRGCFEKMPVVVLSFSSETNSGAASPGKTAIFLEQHNPQEKLSYLLCAVKCEL